MNPHFSKEQIGDAVRRAPCTGEPAAPVPGTSHSVSVTALSEIKCIAYYFPDFYQLLLQFTKIEEILGTHIWSQVDQKL